MNLMKILAGITTLIVLAYGGTYAYMHSKVKGAMDQIAMQAMAAGDFRYSGVSVSPVGSAFTIKGIHFIPDGYSDPVLIDKIYFQVPNMVSLMKLSDFNLNTEFPEKADINISGIHINLSADWFQEMVKPVTKSVAAITYKPELCGGKLFLGPDEYKEMGITQLVLDVSTGFYHDKNAGQMDNHIELVIRNLAGLKLELSTTAPRGSRLVDHANFGQPVIMSNRLTYTDKSYTRKTNEYCAKVGNMSVAEYIEARVAQRDLDYLLSWGFIPGEDLRSAFKTFLSNPTTVEFTIDPAEGFNPAMLAHYNAHDIPSVLNLQIWANNTLVRDLSFKTADELEISPEVAKELANADQYSVTGQLGYLSSLLTPKDQRVKRKKAKPKLKKEKPHYRKIKLGDAQMHIGKEVKVYTYANKVRKGTLEKADGSRLYVVQTLSGGKFTMPVNYKQVAKVEAFY